jgi:hypothetical protein
MFVLVVMEVLQVMRLMVGYQLADSSKKLSLPM